MKTTVSDLGISYDIPKEVIEEIAKEKQKRFEELIDQRIEKFFEDKTDSDFKKVIEKLKAM